MRYGKQATPNVLYSSLLKKGIANFLHKATFAGIVSHEVFKLCLEVHEHDLMTLVEDCGIVFNYKLVFSIRNCFDDLGATSLDISKYLPRHMRHLATYLIPGRV